LPFTLAHPAVVVPLRRRLTLSALVTGSLAPDFHYFLNLWPHSHFMHSLRGAFLFSLPVSLALLWIFQRFMKLPLMSLAPRTHQERLAAFAAPFRWGPASRFALILFALMVGICSHVAWDAFTHDHGFVVRNLPDLRAPAFPEFGTGRPLWNVLQHASSLVGMAIVPVWYWLWLRRAAPEPVPHDLRLTAAWKAWIGISMLLLAGGIAFVDAWVDSDHLAYRTIFAGTFSIMFMSLVYIEILSFSAWWHWRRSRQQSALGKPPTPFVVRQSPSGHPDAYPK
jgi:hypothetical protein